MEPRAYQSGAAGTPPPLPANPVSGYPQSASLTQRPTNPGPFWFYGWGEEIRETIVGAGLTPDPRDNTQLAQAILLIGARAGAI